MFIPLASAIAVTPPPDIKRGTERNAPPTASKVEAPGRESDRTSGSAGAYTDSQVSGLGAAGRSDSNRNESSAMSNDKTNPSFMSGSLTAGAAVANGKSYTDTASCYIVSEAANPSDYTENTAGGQTPSGVK